MMRMSLSIKDTGEKLAIAGRLKHRPVCIYGAENVPDGSMKVSDVDRCIAKAIFKLASDVSLPPVYISAADEDSCMGGRTWLGFAKMHPLLKYFVTIGTKEFRGGAAEHLKATPELFEKSFDAVGKITPPGKYVIASSCSSITDDPGVRSVLCFGGSEQIRNLAGLAQFKEWEQFSTVITPGGPTCATYITYPAGMAEKAPKRAVYTGPTDPTGNIWFPPELMAIGIPIEKAREMAENLDESFLGKRARIAYPVRRAPDRL